MAQKRRGRPPLPPGSKQKPEPVLSLRISEYLKKSLDDLAKERGRTPSAQKLSAEVKRALQFWIKRHAAPYRHNSKLGTAIAALADRVEEMTHKKWVDDPLTRNVVREHVQELISHTLSPLSSEPVPVPADVKEQAELTLALLKHVMGSPIFAGTVIIDDPGFAMTLQYLGEGRVNVETRPALVQRRMQQRRKK